MRAALLDAVKAGELSVFDAIQRLDEASGLDNAGRKNDGVTYTPPAIARGIIDLLDIQEHETTLEPSVGRGIFVFCLIEFLHEQRAWSWERVARWCEQRLLVQDLDAQAVADFLDLWTAFFIHHGVTSSLVANARVGDALFGAWSERSVHVVVGNPPYVRFQNLDKNYRERLQAAFPSCVKGNVDLFYAFYTQALRQGQRVGFITPNSFLSNASAKVLRAELHPRIVSVVDFQARLVFAPVRAYTAIVILDTPEQMTNRPVHYRHDLPSESQAPWHTTPRNGARLNNIKGWNLRDAEVYHEHNGATLGDHANVHGGIATLSDASFTWSTSTIVTGSAGLGAFVVTQDPLRQNASTQVPLFLAPRLFKLTKASNRTALLAQTARMLCPYDEAWQVIPEDVLAQAAPEALTWFQARSSKLLGRDKGATADYEAWYAYGRRQGFYTFDPDERLLLIPIMTTGPLAPIEVTAADLGGRFLIQSGYVVRPKSTDDYEQVKATLASEATWQRIKREGKAWAGGKDYRTFGTKLLKSLAFE